MTLAWHSLIDFHDCDLDAINDLEGLRALMIRAIKEAGGTYVTDVFHQFSPHGLSGIVVIAESHVAIHTWPEHGFAALDIFSCTRKLDQAAIITALAAWLKSAGKVVNALERGTMLAGIGTSMPDTQFHK